jgi:hypothetical protein
LKIQYYIFLTAVSKKQFSAITNLAHLCFAKGRQIIKELNCRPQQIGVLSARFCASHSVQSKAQACRSIVFYSLIFNLINSSIK